MFPDLEFIKTCLNGLRYRIEQVEKQIKNWVENWVTSFVHTNRPNWAQNDPEALDYVKNRTHWDDESQTQTIDYNAWTGDRPSIPLILGVWYEVSWSSAMTGNVYAQYMNTDEADGRFECKQNSDGELYVGYENGLSFCIYTDRTEIDTTWFRVNRVNGLRLTGEITPGLHKLDKKYISRDVLNEIYTLENSVEQQNLALSEKIDANNPTLTGAFSLNRKADTTVGNNSFAAGYNSTASGDYSFAAGLDATASGALSYALGGRAPTVIGSTKASGDGSYALGVGATASGKYSYALGVGATASGAYSYALGDVVTASSNCSFVTGRFNVEDTSSNYLCIVGNGKSLSTPSNAYTLDWSGNGWFAGDVFVGGSSQDDGVKLLKTGEAIPIPTTASVGQTIVVKAVDENGKPTEWEMVNSPISLPSVTVEDAGKVLTVNADGTGYELKAPNSFTVTDDGAGNVVIGV